jgi:hypothetical protein
MFPVAGNTVLLVIAVDADVFQLAVRMLPAEVLAIFA